MKKIGIIAMFLVLLTACQEEIGFNKVQEGIPARMGLTLSLSSSDRIQTRGVKDYESEINELILIMYESSGRKMVVDLTGNLEAGAADGAYGGHRTYTTREQIETDINGDPILSGTYRVYAIANWSSPFCEMRKADLIAMSESELNSAIGTNGGFVYALSRGQRFPMTGYTEGIEVKPYETEGETEITGIKLRRLTSRIEFYFVNGENVNFVPKYYQIFNIPSGAYLMDNRATSTSDAAANKYDGTYGSSEVINIVSGGEIAFFMQENVQGPAAGVGTYADRDKWNGLDSDGKKIFTNAPENATYVVVTGEYEDGQYTGIVSYTIHLGKFGKSTDASRAYDNFEVCRNEYHTYTITVNGVDSILTEAETDQENGGNVPGAEGNLTLTNKGSQFVLDAHYETVMLNFKLSALCANATMIVSTPYTLGMNEYDLYIENASDPAGAAREQLEADKVDYKWISFAAPESIEELRPFPTASEQNAGALTDLVGLALELRQARLDATNDFKNWQPDYDHIHIEKRSTIDESLVYVIAYVDEYFYETEPGGNVAEWPDFVNKDNRTMILNPDRAVSEDENSIVYPDYIFQLSQRSIKTGYNTGLASVNGFGIETWNETGQVYWNDDFSSSDLRSESDGYANTAAIIGYNWLSDEVIETTGYLRSVADNSKESHVYSAAGNLDGICAQNACLTRNRDENGNGVIDAGELKWYLPAVNQFTTMWLGVDYLQEDTQLFDPRIEEVDPSDEGVYNLWISTGYNMVEYWAMEGASYGWQRVSGATNGVRCVRNLYDTDRNGIYDDGVAEIVANNPSKNVITVLGASESALRTTEMSGEYQAGHNERDFDNRLPLAFEVAQFDLGYNTGSGSTGSEYATATVTLDNIGQMTFKFDLLSKEGNSIMLRLVPESGYDYYGNSNENMSWNSYQTSSNGAEPWLTLTVERTSDKVQDKVCVWFEEGINGVFVILYKHDGIGAAPNWGLTNYELGRTNSIGQISSGNTISIFTADEIRGNAGICANYSQDGDSHGWRVPNQRELMLMARFNYLTEASESRPYASSTFYKYAKDLGKYNPFMCIGQITLNTSISSFHIRCVRDAAPDQATTNDSVFINSGSTIF